MTREKDYSDVRRFMRLPVSQRVEYKELGDTIDTSKLRTSKLKNLSPGGLQFTSDRPARPDDVLQLKFSITLAGRKAEIPVIARVIHCRRAKPGQYAIGVEFVEFQWEDIHTLHNFVKKRAKPKR
ncbi:MAG TPA: PilZ domain-containing protein [Candidatus Edwardsbacteria bacterium]|nr:PilZ domain-containing protein [Candidatus Edwardsbacteria bacterium]